MPNPVTNTAQTLRVDHPTGTAAGAATVLVWIVSQFGVDVPAEVAAAAVGLIAVVVSVFTPRFRAEVEDQISDNVPRAGNTGPDRADD